VHFGFWQFNGF
jgi:hypothetical protein